jgi:broad specificity phosphatase PhoE
MAAAERTLAEKVIRCGSRGAPQADLHQGDGDVEVVRDDGSCNENEEPRLITGARKRMRQSHNSRGEVRMTRIVLVRHGETEWNRVERFRGRADVPLNERGISQAEAVARRIQRSWQATAVYSSPLSRAVRTAEAIARRLSLSVQVHPGLLDIDYGMWEGLSPDEVRQRWPELLLAWYEKPHTVRIPGGESLDELRSRCGEVLEEIAARHTESTVVLVGHTVVNRIILLAVLGLGSERFWHLRQDTCAINEIESDGQEFTLASMNDTCHLHVVETGL